MKMKSPKITFFAQFKIACLALSVGAVSGLALASDLNVSNIPLYIDSSVEPNVMFVVDDSLSMVSDPVLRSGARDVYEISENGFSDYYFQNGESLEEVAAICNGVSSMAFNPDFEYEPWSGVNNEEDAYQDATITAAFLNPYDAKGGTVDLTVTEGLLDEEAGTRGEGFYGYVRWIDHNENGDFDMPDVAVGESTLRDLNTNGVFDGWYDLNNDGLNFIDENGNGIREDDEPFDASEWESTLECLDTRYEPFASDPDAVEAWIVTVAEMSAAEKTNFANWYSYYREREYVLKKALSDVISQSSTRMGMERMLGDAGGVVDTTSTPIISITDMSEEANKEALLKELFEIDSSVSPQGWTPTRSTMIRVGEYFADDEKGPILSEDEGGHCQQNFAVLLTDGYWTDQDGDSINVGNVDGAAAYDNTPFEDDYSNTLADITMYYYENDLSETVRDEVPNSLTSEDRDGDGVADNLIENDDGLWVENDDLTFQHLVTYTVSFGVDGTLASDVNPWDPDFEGWPQPTSNSEEALDDTWHAAYNAGGQYLKANDPQALIDAINSALASINKGKSSASSVAVTSGSISTNLLVFQVEYNSETWSGNVNAIPFDSELAGYLDMDREQFATYLPEFDDRRIITFVTTTDPDTGEEESGAVPFRWTNLTAAQQTSLTGADFWDDVTDTQAFSFDGADLVDYLRGQEPAENSDSPFRVRKAVIDSAISSEDHLAEEEKSQVHNPNSLSVLGDIVNSSPVYVGEPQFLYPDTLEPDPYSGFLADPDYDGLSETAEDQVIRRTPMLYIGGNDGMLHAFNVDPNEFASLEQNADSDFGKEVFAYVPSMLIDKLPELAKPSYVHEFYVDSTPYVGDAYINVDGSEHDGWRTVLVSGLGAGGQGIFAIDVTEPDKFTSEEEVAKNVLWEFSDSDDKDLGFTFSQPKIIKLNNGSWAAVFGNGFDNVEEDGIVGSGTPVLYLIDLEDGTLIEKLDTEVNDMDAAANGLANVAPLDVNGDYLTDYIYAGDLEGNLWKFDISSTKTEEWGVAYDESGKNQPLFTACSGDECDTTNRQPITTTPLISEHLDEFGHVIYVGTGQYFLSSDNSNTDVQSVYGVWDRHLDNDAFEDFAREHLLEQQILQEQNVIINNDGDITEQRLTTNNQISWYTGNSLPTDSDLDGFPDEHLGWFMDLVNQETQTKAGERVIRDMSIRGNILYVNTAIASDDPCGPGSDGWLMVMEANDGSQPEDPVIDVNLDGVIDENDVITDSEGNSVASGGTKVGLAECVFVTLENGEQECVYDPTDEDPDTITTAADQSLGRRNWRELTPQ